MNDRQQLAALGEEMAGRAMDLFEQKSPHQLAVELVAMQDRCDSLAAEFSENARQCGAMAELLREIAKWILNGDAGDFVEVVRRIDALLAGKVPEPAQVAPGAFHHLASCDLFKPRVIGDVFVPRACDCGCITAAPKPQGGEASC